MVSKIATALVICGFVQLCFGSAIPIWELLNRGEKMSHLYSTFAYLVSDYCKTNSDARSTPTAKCKRELLSFGLNQLQGMSNHQLDILDPYQRGSNEIIWEAIMRNHPTVKTSPPRIPPLTLSGTPSIIFGSASSNHQRNPLFEDTEVVSQGYPPHREPQNHLHQEGPSRRSQGYLSGPSVVRVRTDGSPVDDDSRIRYSKTQKSKQGRPKAHFSSSGNSRGKKH